MDFTNTIHIHMKNKFESKEKIEYINNITDDKLDKLIDNKIYKASFGCLAIDIVDSKKHSLELGPELWSKIISEFTYGVTLIIKNEYKGMWITIQGDALLSIFNTQYQLDVNNLFNCACQINTFIKHLNKNISKLLLINFKLEVGIGIWDAKESYITKVGLKGERDIVFIGEPVNYAMTLANSAGRKNLPPILMNKYVKENSKRDKGYWTHLTEHNIDGINVLGCNYIIKDYSDFIKNNV